MKMHEETDVAVIGAGVVGLAIAREFARSGKKVLIFEAADAIGTETSARGSHVVHSGIYYTPGSLKARLCVDGKKLIYEYCEEKGVAYKKLGKIIVATDESEATGLEVLKARAEQNGVSDLEWLTSEDMKKREPAARCARALFSPSTGIIDGPGLLRALLNDVEERGASLFLKCAVRAGEVVQGGIVLTVEHESAQTIFCGTVINAAGLRAQEVAKSISGIRAESIPQAYFAKGHYFTLKGASPFAHLIYPVPVPGGLGIHATLDVRGETRFGPDVVWVDAVDYTFDFSKEAFFYEAIRRYYPGLPDGSLVPSHTGIRPKLVPQGRLDHDFVIQGEDEHGASGFINLFGIESPGFTSSLAIAREVAHSAH